jgi:hypothetical protein
MAKIEAKPEIDVTLKLGTQNSPNICQGDEREVQIGTHPACQSDNSKYRASECARCVVVGDLLNEAVEGRNRPSTGF